MQSVRDRDRSPPLGMLMTSHGQCPRGGGACECQSGGVCQFFVGWMTSRRQCPRGGACECSFTPPPSGNPVSAPDTYGSNTPLPLLGVTDVTLAHNGQQFKTEIHIVKGSGGNLLGFQAAQELGIISIAQQVSHSSPCPDNAIAQRFPGLFSGIGKIRNKVIKLHIDETVVPKQQRHRRIPFHVRKDVEVAKAQLEADDIIEKADGPTPWVSPLVVVPKKFRLCIDMREANKAIQREKHVMPTIDDLIADLNGAQVFSTLDLAQGCQQYELDPNSRYITTFSTNKALYHYKRLMFGLNAASEIFHNAVAEMLCGLEGAKNISDDIIVFGRTQDEHDRNLQATFQRLAQHNARLKLTQGILSTNRNILWPCLWQERSPG